MASAPDQRMAHHGGESRTGHFEHAAKTAYFANGVHNGMNEHPEIGRFGNDMMSGDPDRRYDPGAWDGPSMHDRIMGHDKDE